MIYLLGSSAQDILQTRIPGMANHPSPNFPEPGIKSQTSCLVGIPNICLLAGTVSFLNLTSSQLFHFLCKKLEEGSLLTSSEIRHLNIQENCLSSMLSITCVESYMIFKIILLEQN